MFGRDELMLGLASEAARTQLVNLTHGGWLVEASGGAYADGLAGPIRVGPFGAVPGASKLVSVRFLEPVPRGRHGATAELGGDRRHRQALANHSVAHVSVSACSPTACAATA